MPRMYPTTAISSPIGAIARWYTPATTGAEAAPPILAMLPVATKKSGAAHEPGRDQQHRHMDRDPDRPRQQVHRSVEHRPQIGPRPDPGQEKVQGRVAEVGGTLRLQFPAEA